MPQPFSGAPANRAGQPCPGSSTRSGTLSKTPTWRPATSIRSSISCCYGAAELRAPAADFDIAFYTNRYGDALGGQNPLLHYLTHQDQCVTQLPDRKKAWPAR